jgi:hypothetical protein
MRNLDKNDIEWILREDLKRVLSTETFYKYCGFDTALDKILCEQTLKFSNPTEFNDPFDGNECILKLNHDKKLVEEVIELNKTQTTREQRRKLKKDLFKKTSYDPILRAERDKYKLSCFSGKYDEVLMWSYYADMHKGMCVGFDFPPKYDEKFLLCPVKYLSEIIPINGSSDVIRTILYWITTKSSRWKYEDEIRAVTKTQTEKPVEFITYDKKYVKEIIFGCKVSTQKIEYAIRKLKKNGFDIKKIKFKRMVINENTFLLKEEKLINTAYNKL